MIRFEKFIHTKVRFYKLKALSLWQDHRVLRRINNSLTFCNGTYYSNQGITIINNNVKIFCNRTVLTGNTSLWNSAISASNKRNISIENCIFKDYAQGISFNNVTDSLLKNNIGINSKYAGFFASDSNNLTFLNNSVVNSYHGFEFSYSYRFTAINNSMINLSNTGFNLQHLNNSLITNNVEKNVVYGVIIYGSHKNFISQNKLDEGINGIFFFGDNINNSVLSNVVSNFSQYGLSIGYVGNVDNLIINNSFYNKGVYDINQSTNIYCSGNVSNNYLDGAIGPTCPCSPNLTNTSWTNWSNVSCLINDKMNQTRSRVQYDSNNCGTISNQTFYENKTNETCNYCNPNIIGPFNTSWSSCSEQGIKTRTKYFIDLNYPSCCLVTSLNSDCQINNVSYQNVTETSTDNCGINLMVSSPEEGIFNINKNRLNLFSSSTFTTLEYIDNSSKKPKWSTLCVKCDSYNKLKSFNDGPHNLTFKGILLSGQTVFNQTSFFIDTKNPKISITKPTNRKYTNGSDFYVKYSEENCKSLGLLISGQQSGGGGVGSCESGRNVEKYLTQDLTSFDGQEIEYYFTLIDIANNTDESKPVKVKVDVTPPKITNFNYSIDRRYVQFNITINELNFEGVEYIDNSDSEPRWNSLCSRLKNEQCYIKKNFKVGNHNITIKVLDKAGNLVEENIGFSIN